MRCDQVRGGEARQGGTEARRGWACSCGFGLAQAIGSSRIRESNRPHGWHHMDENNAWHVIQCKHIAGGEGIGETRQIFPEIYHLLLLPLLAVIGWETIGRGHATPCTSEIRLRVGAHARIVCAHVYCWRMHAGDKTCVSTLGGWEEGSSWPEAPVHHTKRLHSLPPSSSS